MQENLASADIALTDSEVLELDTALDQMTMSDVFGGSRIVK
ncbi:MAG: hypothetical protein ACOYB8_11610 [Eubacteriaceae bacterium]